MKLKKIVIPTVALTMAMTMTSFAYVAGTGAWKQGEGEDQGRWYYEFYPYDNEVQVQKDCWNWIDGNQDGIAECYYFDDDGWLVTDATITQSVYGIVEVSRTVNHDGQWVKDDVVQIMTKQKQKELSDKLWSEFFEQTSNSLQTSSDDGGFVTEQDLIEYERQEMIMEAHRIAVEFEEGSYSYSRGEWSPYISIYPRIY